MTLGTHEHAVGHRLRRQGHHDRSRGPPSPSTARRTWRSGPRATSTSRDGYGNCRVHHFSPTGELKRSWGVPGSGPGQFYPPARHRRRRRRPRLRLRPRERPHPDLQPRRRVSRRVDRHAASDPRRVRRQGRAYVSELWWQPGQTSRRHGPIAEARPGRVSVYDRDGRVLARWGGPDASAPGSFAAPHGIAVDSQGRRLRERGDVDVRGEPRARPRPAATPSRSSGCAEPDLLPLADSRRVRSRSGSSER